MKIECIDGIYCRNSRTEFDRQGDRSDKDSAYGGVV